MAPCPLSTFSFCKFNLGKLMEFATNTEEKEGKQGKRLNNFILVRIIILSKKVWVIIENTQNINCLTRKTIQSVS